MNVSVHSSEGDGNFMEELDSLHGSGTLSGVPTLSDSLDNLDVFEEDAPMHDSIQSVNLTELEEAGSMLMTSDNHILLNSTQKSATDGSCIDSRLGLSLYNSDVETDDKMEGSAFVEFHQLEAEVLGNVSLSRTRSATMCADVNNQPSTCLINAANLPACDNFSQNSLELINRSESCDSNEYSNGDVVQTQVSQYKHNPTDFFLEDERANNRSHDLETVTVRRPRPESQVDPITVHDQMIEFLEQENTSTPIRRQNSEPFPLKRPSCRFETNLEASVDVPLRRVSFIQLNEMISPRPEQTSEEHTTASSITGNTDREDSRSHLKMQLQREIVLRERQERYIEQLQKYYDALLAKHAMAELTIDHLRLGAHVNITTRRNTISTAQELLDHHLTPSDETPNDTHFHSSATKSGDLVNTKDAEIQGSPLERHSSSPNLFRNKSTKLFSSSPSLEERPVEHSPLDNIVTQTRDLHAEANRMAELVAVSNSNLSDFAQSKVQELRHAYDTLQQECSQSKKLPFTSQDAVRTAEADLFQLGMCLDDVEQKVVKMTNGSVDQGQVYRSSSTLAGSVNPPNVDHPNRRLPSTPSQSLSTPSVQEKPLALPYYQSDVSCWKEELPFRQYDQHSPNISNVKVHNNLSFEDLSFNMRKHLHEISGPQRPESVYRHTNETSINATMGKLPASLNRYAPNPSKQSPVQHLAGSPHIALSSQRFSPDQLSDSGFVTLRTLPNSPSNSRVIVGPPASNTPTFSSQAPSTNLRERPSSYNHCPTELNTAGRYGFNSLSTPKKGTITRPSTLSMRHSFQTEPHLEPKVLLNNFSAFKASLNDFSKEDFQSRRQRILSLQEEIRELRKCVLDSLKLENVSSVNHTSRTSSASTLRPGNMNNSKNYAFPFERTTLPENRNEKTFKEMPSSSAPFNEHANGHKNMRRNVMNYSTENSYHMGTLQSNLTSRQQEKSYGTGGINDTWPRTNPLLKDSLSTSGLVAPLKNSHSHLSKGVSNERMAEGSAGKSRSPTTKRRHSKRHRDERYFEVSHKYKKDAMSNLPEDTSSEDKLPYEELRTTKSSKYPAVTSLRPKDRLSSPDIRSFKSSSGGKVTVQPMQTIVDNDGPLSPHFTSHNSLRSRIMEPDPSIEYRPSSNVPQDNCGESDSKIVASTRYYSSPSLVFQDRGNSTLPRRRGSKKDVFEEFNDLGVYNYGTATFSPDYEGSDDCARYHVREYSCRPPSNSRPTSVYRPVVEDNPLSMSLTFATPTVRYVPPSITVDRSHLDTSQRHLYRRSLELDRDRLRDTLCDALLSMTRVAEEISHDLRHSQISSLPRSYSPKTATCNTRQPY